MSDKSIGNGAQYESKHHTWYSSTTLRRNRRYYPWRTQNVLTKEGPKMF